MSLAINFKRLVYYFYPLEDYMVKKCEMRAQKNGYSEPVFKAGSRMADSFGPAFFVVLSLEMYL